MEQRQTLRAYSAQEVVEILERANPPMVVAFIIINLAPDESFSVSIDGRSFLRSFTNRMNEGHFAASMFSLNHFPNTDNIHFLPLVS